MVDDPVERRRGHLVVPEHRAPPAELQVRCDDHRLPLVGGGEHLEEQPRAVGVQRQEAELVDDEQPRAADERGLPVEAPLVAGAPQEPHSVLQRALLVPEYGSLNLASTWKYPLNHESSLDATTDSRRRLPVSVALSRTVALGVPPDAAGDMSFMPAIFATVLRLTPSLLAIFARGTLPASIDRISFTMSRGTTLALSLFNSQ